MKAIRARLSYANVVATLALVLALGGVSWAATKLPKNSVGTKQIKNNAVTGAKVKKHTLTGKDINLNKLGTVPSAKNATSATTASSLTPPEAVRLVGAAGQPQFLDGTVNFPPEQGVSFHPVGFYKDHEGIVHLEGMAQVGTGENPITGLLFQLPPGYRPAAGIDLVFPNVEDEETISVLGSNIVSGGHNLEGDVYANGGKETIVSLSGVTFRAES
ncbi:MAG TPA: hypothetical protein VGF09_07860 [Solirubrobacterales bacterium]|jgi:hypothetical protein